ncbi:hypothetical protein ACPPVU_09320 [Mucilaginibacter sp. McL0603]|uniref:hypothetical protein n=1 Tax=Mucilaginibacter sp. McL0603 TaxID=3415670 RepID=UPI003CF59884
MDIRKFLHRLLLFGMVALPLVSMESLYSYFTRSYELAVNGNEIYISIRKSKVQKKVKILIIGDSMGKQLYDNKTYNDSIYSLTCNQAISMAGYYILLQNFIKKNRNNLPGKVVLIVGPSTLRNNLDQTISYHYFLKPFYKPENEKYFTAACLDQIRKIPFYYTSQLPFILNTNWSPAYSKSDGPASFRLISPVSNDYLVKIRLLCSTNKMPFSIYCPPVTIANKKCVMQLSANMNEFEKCGMKNEFIVYFKNIAYMPDSLFQDQRHFKKQYIPVDYFNLCRNNDMRLADR